MRLAVCAVQEVTKSAKATLEGHDKSKRALQSSLKYRTVEEIEQAIKKMESRQVSLQRNRLICTGWGMQGVLSWLTLQCQLFDSILSWLSQREQRSRFEGFILQIS